MSFNAPPSFKDQPKIGHLHRQSTCHLLFGDLMFFVVTLGISLSLLILSNIEGGMAQGVSMDIFSGRNFNTYERTVTGAAVSYDWVREAPYEEGPSDNFSVRWRGKLIPPTSTTYQFRANYDDGYRLWIGDQMVINAWSGGPAIIVGEASLRAARITPITIEFYEQGGDARSLLEWRAQDSNEDFSTIPLSSLSAPDENTGLPRVGLAVRDPRALEGNDPARFTVYRLGGLDQELEVELVYSGEAEEGLDYVNPTRTVTIPAGLHALDFDLFRSDDQIARGNKSLQIGIVYTETYTMTNDNEITLTLLDDERDLSRSELYTIAGHIHEGDASAPVIITFIGEEVHTLTRIGSGPFSSPPLPEGQYTVSAWLDSDDDGTFGETDERGELIVGDEAPADELTLSLPPHHLDVAIHFNDPQEIAAGDMAGGMMAGEMTAGETAGEAAEDMAGEDMAGETAGETAEDIAGETAEDMIGDTAEERSDDAEGCLQSHRLTLPLPLMLLLLLSLCSRRVKLCSRRTRAH